MFVSGKAYMKFSTYLDSYREKGGKIIEKLLEIGI